MCPGVCHDPGLRREGCLDLASVDPERNMGDGITQPRPVVIKADLASRGDLFHQVAPPDQSKLKWRHATRRFVAASATAVGLGSLVTVGPVVAPVAEASDQLPNNDDDSSDLDLFLQSGQQVEFHDISLADGGLAEDDLIGDVSVEAELVDVSAAATKHSEGLWFANGEGHVRSSEQTSNDDSEHSDEEELEVVPVEASEEPTQTELPQTASAPTPAVSEADVAEPVVHGPAAHGHILPTEIDESAQEAIDEVLASAASLSEWLAERLQNTAEEPQCVDEDRIADGGDVLWCVDDVAALSSLDSFV